MTQIDFHTKVPDVAAYACRILRIAFNRGAKVVVFDSDESKLAQFDQLLWTFSELDFIPHTFAGTAVASQTPIILTSSDQNLPHHEVILNLALIKPPSFSSFERLVEFVPSEGAALISARERYKFYKDRGYPIKTHEYRDLNQ